MPTSRHLLCVGYAAQHRCTARPPLPVLLRSKAQHADRCATHLDDCASPALLFIATGAAAAASSPDDCGSPGMMLHATCPRQQLLSIIYVDLCTPGMLLDALLM